jgi:exonuclease III
VSPISARIADVKIGTWNVNGIRARQKEVREWIAREQPNVVCLQELKAKQDQVPEALCILAGYWCSGTVPRPTRASGCSELQ